MPASATSGRRLAFFAFMMAFAAVLAYPAWYVAGLIYDLVLNQPEPAAILIALWLVFDLVPAYGLMAYMRKRT